MAVRVGAHGSVSSATPDLELVAVSKQFGEVLALDKASIRVRPGTIHALLGENGAGKTSLMRIVYGMLTPDAGAMQLDGRAMRFRAPSDAIRNGIAMVHQHFSLVPALSAIENFALGGRGRFDRSRELHRLAHYAAQLGLSIAPDMPAHTMSPAQQQQLEIAKALARECHILILDEPTAVLPPIQATALLNWLRAFTNLGRSVVLITHKLRDAVTIADEVTVLRLGRTVLSGSLASVSEQELLAAMLGGALTESRPKSRLASDGSLDATTPTSKVIASLHAVTTEDPRRREHLDNVSIDVAAGEIVGVAGLDGSGHRLLLRTLAGRHWPTRGDVRLPAAIGFIPEDRHHEAVALKLDLRDNVALRDAGARRGWINWQHWTRITQQLVREFDIRASGERSPAHTLSGGNQQKLVLARELAGNPTLIVAENPTSGLDVRAASAIRQRLRAARDAGAAVILYSSDLDELVLDSDRILAVYAGRVRQCEPSRDGIGRAMLGTV